MSCDMHGLCKGMNDIHVAAHVVASPQVTGLGSSRRTGVCWL
jgi:hypothetical protein